MPNNMLSDKFTELKQKIEDGSSNYRHIHISILGYITFRNIASRKLRSFLTVFGVVIGVSAIFFLLSFGLGVQNLVTDQVIGDNSLKSIEINSPNSQILALDESVVNELKTFAHVDSVGVQYAFPGIASVNGGEIDVVTYGIDKTYQNLSNLSLLSGRLLQESDSKNIVISSATLESLGIDDPVEAVDREITINVPLDKYHTEQKSFEEVFTIVGVIYSNSSNEVYIPSVLFDIVGVPTYSDVKVIVDDTAYVELVRAQIESRGFETVSLNDTLDEINNIFRFFNIILVGFGSIGMIVAILGMFNTLTISLLERTREIGLMIALGGRRSDMFKLFTIEAVAISLAGSIIGISLAYIAGRIVNLVINLNARGRGVEEWFDTFSTPFWLILVTILTTLAVGLIVVYIPAKRAERINPLDALKHE